MLNHDQRGDRPDPKPPTHVEASSLAPQEGVNHHDHRPAGAGAGSACPAAARATCDAPNPDLGGGPSKE